MEKVKVGYRGEKTAEQFLSCLGYFIKGRNVRFGHDEIDIVAFDPEDEVMVFAEVKTRSRYFEEYHPQLNITANKKLKMIRAARKWVAEHEYQGGYRLDVVLVVGKRVIDHWREIEY